VAGFYEPRNDVESIRPTSFELLSSDRVALRLAGDPAPTHYSIAVPPEALEATTDRLGRAFPQAVVINKAEYGSFINRSFRGLFLFVIAVAGLALVAGAVLIANAVGLAMIERRRELGILKAIGYTSSRVLRTVQLENALLGFLGGAAGVAGVFIVIAVVNARYPQANLSLTLWQALILVGISLVLAVGSATAVAWPPTHARPLTVLRSE
jgi:putative ABC transport system permease protein